LGFFVLFVPKEVGEILLVVLNEFENLNH